jgi:hypothetical protein
MLGSARVGKGGIGGDEVTGVGGGGEGKRFVAYAVVIYVVLEVSAKEEEALEMIIYTSPSLLLPSLPPILLTHLSPSYSTSPD